MHIFLKATLILLVSALWSAQSASPDPVQIEPAQRDVWSRGSQRFHKQWLVAGALSPDVANRTNAATLEPMEGRAFSTDVANVRWKAHTSWTEITELNAIAGMPDDGAQRVAFVAGTVSRERAGAADLSIGAQGPIAVWLNGERIYERTKSHAAFARDSERIAVQMRQGENALLLRLEQVDPNAWPFTVRIIEPGALLARSEVIVPYLRGSTNQVEVHTNLTADSAAPLVEVTALGAGGRVLARGTAARGESVTLDASTWSEGAYEFRVTTKDAWGQPYLVHLPWYKGDAAGAAQRLIDAAESAKEEIYSAHLRLLAQIVRDRTNGQLNAALPGLEARIHSPLLEYEEIELDRAQRVGSVRPGGFVRLGYVDQIDGSVQFCRAYLPSNYSDSQRWPLVLSLHGYNPENPPLHRWWSIDQRHSDIAERKNVIYIEPHGRGNAQYISLGERDVLRCLQEAKARFAVDDDRVYLTGESMGGHGTWAIASRNPHLFAAAAPVFGGWDFRVSTIRGPALAENQPSNALEFYIQERRSSFVNAENLLNVPLLVIHGDSDATVSVENSRHATRMLQRWGYNIRYWEMPGWGHEDLQQRLALIDWLLEHRRDSAPRRVRLRSADLSGARAHWLEARAMGEPQRLIRAEAEVVKPGLVRIDSENLAAFDLTLPQSLRGSTQELELVWNGQSQRAQLDNGVARIGMALSKPRGVRKRPGVEGPIPDIINLPFMVVVGTTSRDPHMRRSIEERARDLQDVWMAWQYQPLRVMRDVDVSAADERAYSLILLGGADANAVTRRLGNRLPMSVSAHSIEVDGKRWTVDDAVLQMIYPSPRAEHRYVLVVAATSAMGMQLWKPEFVEPAIGIGFIASDWTIRDGRRPPPLATVKPSDRDVASGVFDANWRRAARWTEDGDAAVRSAWRLRRPALEPYTPSAETLESYRGDYDFGQFVATLSVEGSTLVAHVPTQAPLPLEPKGPNLFRTLAYPTKDAIEFIVDANGTVLGAEVDTQGRTIFGKKVQ
ncbi:prolyl oligopeptidase family serine peptidase [Steroidobacter cummioxidans]|uniref:carboxylesterase family protein n=1 Tax=Steroidobacter cummioxidans TaxID=1803913 RepID=UPI00137AEB15|nr:prolyl oligopeptidase family serine peptidase [Steroidobacter cummioxidans]